MIQGRVTHNREALIELTLRGNQSTLLQIEAVVDTGVSDDLTLHPDEIFALELNYKGTIGIMLANGSTETVSVYNAMVDWDGEFRTIDV